MDKIKSQIIDFVGHKWSIDFKDLVVHDGKTKMGLIEASKCRIEVSLDYPDTMIKSSLLHELIHMIDYVGICDIDEDTAGVLETLLFSLLTKGVFPRVETLDGYCKDCGVSFNTKRFHYFFDRLRDETKILEVVSGSV